MKIGWEIENTVYVDAPCWVVWKLFSDVLHWPALGFGISRVSGNGEPLGPDGEFIFTLKPLGLPVNVKARVKTYRPMQLLAWQGRFWGITSQARILFAVIDPKHTRLTFHEKLNGVGLLLFSALFSMGRLAEVNQKWLNKVAQAAEEQAGALGGLQNNR